jgi:cytochrome P450
LDLTGLGRFIKQSFPALNKIVLTGALAARRYIQFFQDPIGCMRDLNRSFGSLVALGPIAFGEPKKLHVLAVGPEFNRQVLGDPAKFRTTGQFIHGPPDSAQRRIRCGLTRMNGPQHKQQRQLIMPPFHRKAVAGYHDLMVDLAHKIISTWRPGRLDIYREMRTLALRIASAVLFGQKRRDAFHIAQLLEIWTRRNFSASVWLLPLNIPGTAYHRLLKHAKRVEREILSLVEKRRQGSRENTDVLSLLIQARDEEDRGMTDAELVGQATILFGASFETTASTLTWTLFLLAQHPLVMRELMEEFDRVLAGTTPTREQLAELSFLDCVIKESMRILPPVPFTIRATEDDVAMGPLVLGHGTRVICSHHLTHHLPDIYPEPERFRPERWREINPTQYEYMPFSAGPRACIGAMFAFQVLKISLSMMLQKFRFKVVPGARIDRVVRITMNPRYGLPMLLIENDRSFSTAKVAGQIHEMVALPDQS